SKFKVQLLTIIGAALVIPTFATGFFGMNIFKDEIIRWWINKNVVLWMNGYVFLPILIMVVLCTWTRRRTRANHIKHMLLMGVIVISVLVMIRYGCGLG
ncbi:MAG: Mg2 transporter protein CorA family protein, partial [Clostridia bacterium]|nr:Mg2 transporter protein CorA family protein [Clostridia bacterium]